MMVMQFVHVCKAIMDLLLRANQSARSAVTVPLIKHVKMKDVLIHVLVLVGSMPDVMLSTIVQFAVVRQTIREIRSFDVTKKIVRQRIILLI